MSAAFLSALVPMRYARSSTYIISFSSASEEAWRSQSFSSALDGISIWCCHTVSSRWNMSQPMVELISENGESPAESYLSWSSCAEILSILSFLYVVQNQLSLKNLM